jgi:hypothetical protein
MIVKRRLAALAPVACRSPRAGMTFFAKPFICNDILQDSDLDQVASGQHRTDP